LAKPTQEDIVTSVTFSHFHYGSSLSLIAKRIMGVIEQSPIPITPLEISQKTRIKRSTVRKCLARLARKGFIRKFCHGHYMSLRSSVTLASSMVGGVCDVLPRVHCLRFRVSDVAGKPSSWEVDLDVVRICFRRFKNGSAQVFVDCQESYSLDYLGFRLLVEVVVGQLGVDDWNKIAVSSLEINNDFEGERLDGVQAVTLKSFDGTFRRIYNRRLGLRDEVRVVGTRKLEDVIPLLRGGISSYNILQLLYMNFHEIQRQNILIPLVEEAVSQMRRLVEAWFESNERDRPVHLNKKKRENDDRPVH
jgi:hypothetical protein